MAEPKPVSYLLTSVVRGRANRTARAAVPGRMPFVQRLAGGRIVVRRARPARISEAVLLANLVEIKAAVAKHQLVVTTPDGRPVDLTTFQVSSVAAVSPPPNPPLDSAKNDKNEGVGYKVPGAPEGTTSDSEEPELLRPSSLMAPEISTESEPAEEPTAVEEVLEIEPDSEVEVEPEPASESSSSVKSESSPPPSRHGKGKRGRS